MALLKSQQKLHPADKAPAFTLKNIDGEMVSLSDFEGKAVVIIFMCNHCPYVQPKMQEIADIQDEYADEGVVVIGINANDFVNYPEDDFAHMQGYAQRYGYRFYLLDDTQQIAKAYGAVCTPDPFVFDKEHKLVYHGRINDAMNPDEEPTQHDLRLVLDKVVKGEKVKVWFEPSQGCNIKWKD